MIPDGKIFVFFFNPTRITSRIAYVKEEL